MTDTTPQAGPLTTEELFRLHGPFVERFLARLGVPADQAEDALQDVFLVVHRNGGYRPGLAKPTSYLAGIALHAAYKHRRRERVDRARHTDASTEHVPSITADPTRALLAHEELERLQSALERLPEDLRTTLVLVDIEGESCLSVAAALDMPVGTVYSRLHMARKKLQLALLAVDASRIRQRLTSLHTERRRALGASSLGMWGWLGFGPWFQRSEAAQLLRLAREQTRPTGASEASLLRHRELLQAGADLNVAGWATPHAATWIGVLGPTGIGVVASATVAGLISAWISISAPLHPTTATDTTSPLGAASLLVRAPTPPSPLPDVAPPSPPTASLASVAGSGMQPTASARARPPSGREHRPRARAATAAEATQTEADSAPLAVAQSADVKPTPAQPAQDNTKDNAAQERAPSPPPQAAVPVRDAARPPPALQEMQEIANAERLLNSAPARALAIVRSVQARFPEGYLREERAYVELMALQGLGRTEEAQRQAEAFLSAHPDGPYTRRVRKVAASAKR